MLFRRAFFAFGSALGLFCLTALSLVTLYLQDTPWMTSSSRTSLTWCCRGPRRLGRSSRRRWARWCCGSGPSSRSERRCRASRPCRGQSSSSIWFVLQNIKFFWKLPGTLKPIFCPQTTYRFTGQCFDWIKTIEEVFKTFQTLVIWIWETRVQPGLAKCQLDAVFLEWIKGWVLILAVTWPIYSPFCSHQSCQ